MATLAAMATRTASPLDEIDSILQPGRKLRLVDGPVEAGIWTAIDGEPGAQRYESIAGMYDRLIGSRHWQRLIWGNDIARDTELARAAESSSMGWWLDAGCGTLIFTAPVHAESERPTILFDVSIGMLQRARKRLVEHCGRLPKHVVLIQGDVFALPFRASSFETILCPGIIHLFDKPAALLESLEGILAPRVLRRAGGLRLACQRVGYEMSRSYKHRNRPDWRRQRRSSQTLDEFRCQNCRLMVPASAQGTRHRNHCPACLWSVHVDDHPGDRSSECGARMEPIAIWVQSNGEWSLVHRCNACGCLKSNRIAADDNAFLLMSLAARPVAQPPFPLNVLGRPIRRSGPEGD